MIKTTTTEDCENDPKKQLVKDFNIAFAKEDIDFILNCFVEDAHWEMVGAQAWDGKEAISAALKTMNGGEASELVINNILSEDNRCVADGVIKYPDGSAVAYCDVYAFTGHEASPKIKTLTAYAIELKSRE